MKNLWMKNYSRTLIEWQQRYLHYLTKVITVSLKSIYTKNSSNSTNNTRITTKTNAAKIGDPTSSIQVQAGNMSENVLNEIWQILFSLYPAKQI